MRILSSVFESLNKVLKLIEPSERRQSWWILFLLFVGSLLETLSFASIFPFLALLSEPKLVEENVYLRELYFIFGSNSRADFHFTMGILILVVFVGSNIFKGYTLWKVNHFSQSCKRSFSVKLLRHYLALPYLRVINKSTPEILTHLLTSVDTAIVGVLFPYLTLASNALTACWLVGVLFLADPLISFLAFSLLGGIYFSIYFFVKKKMEFYGKETCEVAIQVNKSISDPFGGLKEIKYLGRSEVFVGRFRQALDRYIRFYINSQFLSNIPPLFVESFAFGGGILVVLMLIKTHGNITSALPVIGLFAVTTKRLVPTFQAIFAQLSRIRSSKYSLDILYQDFLQFSEQVVSDRALKIERLPFNQSIEFRNINFSYPSAKKQILKNINLTIPTNSIIGFVGSTGAGKTTLIDLLLGILNPDSGSILIDGRPLAEKNRANWQANIGYVPQQVFLSDDSILSNVAFGIEPLEISREAVELACRRANIHDFIVSELPGGYDTMIGERGIRLSGGQRQRLGIARALYHDPPVIIFDEATNALDGVTEGIIMQEILSLAGKKTIITIAHRLSTVRKCDTIFHFEKGELVAQGTFSELIISNPDFFQPGVLQ